MIVKELVPLMGLEPIRLKARDFKSLMATITSQWYKCRSEQITRISTGLSEGLPCFSIFVGSDSLSTPSRQSY